MLFLYALKLQSWKLLSKNVCISMLGSNPAPDDKKLVKVLSMRNVLSILQDMCAPDSEFSINKYL